MTTKVDTKLVESALPLSALFANGMTSVPSTETTHGGNGTTESQNWYKAFVGNLSSSFTYKVWNSIDAMSQLNEETYLLDGTWFAFKEHVDVLTTLPHSVRRSLASIREWLCGLFEMYRPNVPEISEKYLLGSADGGTKSLGSAAGDMCGEFI